MADKVPTRRTGNGVWTILMSYWLEGVLTSPQLEHVILNGYLEIIFRIAWRVLNVSSPLGAGFPAVTFMADYWCGGVGSIFESIKRLTEVRSQLGKGYSVCPWKCFFSKGCTNGRYILYNRVCPLNRDCRGDGMVVEVISNFCMFY